MIKSLWIAGIIIALSIFGIKVGLGTAAVLYGRAIPGRKKLLFLSGIVSVYSLLFFGLYALTRHFQLLNYLDKFLQILRYGMVIHIVIALGLVLWGVKLLLSGDQQLNRNNYRGAIFLIFPCPICAIVIFLTLSLAYSLFPFSLVLTTGLLLGIFLGVSLVTMLITFPFRRHIGKAGSSFLGLAMVMVAIYFFLIILIAPIYQETQEIYQLASESSGGVPLDLRSFLVFLVIAVILFSIGFFRQYRKVNFYNLREE